MSLGKLIIGLCNAGFGAIEVVHRCLGRPEVRTITTSDLHSAMNSDRTPPVLVDVRSDSEVAVSRIPGAITQQEYEKEAESLAGRHVVTYCTVGGRSYLYARKLVAAGVDATNYRDSILGWCRDGLPLESPDKQPTKAVHPYWRIFRVPDQYDVKT
ncbi:rhodanese-like domain-containing protein [Novipirellula artificiosorum]|uniref:Molybdopterin biosynthesis protein MoeB n=1 Tax=Novipirellula artificiosorum TaxID=2528016 RepID=A0A5C6DRW7_9BACT|nr:rhodanese-like domain-containing protein [Novipirellula artificiosorum]TWU39508.1 molybdopterin biosynthesis protein MoeB [Novipirellula artificiosorum]